MELEITRETKVGAFLDAYPQLEEVLIDAAPMFVKLRNPILRRSVAKMVTLQQAAETAGISAEELVNRLRVAAGQPAIASESAAKVGGSGRPEWAVEDRVQARLRADEILGEGQHPLGKIREALAKLPPEAVLKVSSTFRPVPLEQALTKAGIPVWIEEIEADRFDTWIAR